MDLNLTDDLDFSPIDSEIDLSTVQSWNKLITKFRKQKVSQLRKIYRKIMMETIEYQMKMVMMWIETELGGCMYGCRDTAPVFSVVGQDHSSWYPACQAAYTGTGQNGSSWLVLLWYGEVLRY